MLAMFGHRISSASLEILVWQLGEGAGVLD